MKKASTRLILRLVCLLGLTGMSSLCLAQEGHPLSGTWLGDWGTQESSQHFLTLIMEWDGTAISGQANPGPNTTSIGQITLHSADWSVSIDMPMKDDNGTQIQFKGQGKLENLGAQTRTLNGTWEANGESGTFTLTRQSGA